MLFQKVEFLVKAVKKCFLKKLSVWLEFIKVAFWVVNYQKGQCMCGDKGPNLYIGPWTPFDNVDTFEEE